jgi:hypothetical protein
VRHDREREKGGHVQDLAGDRDRPHAQASVNDGNVDRGTEERAAACDGLRERRHVRHD